MNEPSTITMPVLIAGSRRRAALPPPWPVSLGFGLLVASRLLNSLISLMRPHVEVSIVFTAMVATVAMFWFWPAVDKRDPSQCGPIGVRLGLAVGVIYAAAYSTGLLLRGYRPPPWAFFFYLMLPVYNAALAYPFARLFANLRLDARLPSSSALGPCALFAFFATMMPAAIVQMTRPDSLPHLRSVLIGVPSLTVVLILLFLRDRRSTAPGWWVRELGSLLWRNARLPFLLLLGELGVMASGVMSGYD